MKIKASKVQEHLLQVDQNKTWKACQATHKIAYQANKI